MSLEGVLTMWRLKDVTVLDKILYGVQANSFDKKQITKITRQAVAKIVGQTANVIYCVTTDNKTKKRTYKLLDASISFNNEYFNTNLTHFVTNATISRLEDFGDA